MVIIGSKRGILNVACLRLQLGQVPFVKDVLFQNNNEEEDDGEEQKSNIKDKRIDQNTIGTIFKFVFTNAYA